MKSLFKSLPAKKEVEVSIRTIPKLVDIGIRMLVLLIVVLGASQIALLWADPVLVDPTHFRIQLFADFSTLPTKPKAFYLNLTRGVDGFPAGLYVRTDFLGSHQLLRVNGQNQITVVKDGLENLEATLFATGAYGTGMLITRPINQQIIRLLPNGSVTTFATVGTSPFGPAGMAYAPDGSLLVADYTGGNILRVASNGSSSIFASFPGDTIKSVLTLDPGLASRFGAPILAGTFDDPSDTIFGVSADGKSIFPIAGGFTFLEFLTPGPGGRFGSNVFVSEFGPDNIVEGGKVSILAPDGTVTPFLTGINAADVAFDTTGILGGGMFISDFNGAGELAGKIWRVTAIPEPGFGFLLSVEAAALWFVGFRRKL